MKTRYNLLTGVAMLAVTAAFGQVEHDDMYFNSKDRAKLNASMNEVLAKQYKQEDLQAAKISPINPTDSYSGRSVNPEYTNRLKTNPNVSSNDSQYFVSGYQPMSVNQNLASNKCNCTSNNYMNSPYSNYGGYGGYGMNSFYGMNSGFGSPYSSLYSPWGMGGMGSGFYQPGWSTMLGYGFGGMSSGMYGGMSYGFGNSWGSPWSNYGYGSFFNNGYYGGMPYGYGSGYSNYYNTGNNVVINNSGDNRGTTVYGKRSSRSSDTNNLIDHARPETSYTRNGREVSSGRTRSESQSQYYDRAWKSDPDKNPSRSFWSDNSSGNSDGRSRSNWNNSWNSVSTGRQSSSSDWGNNSRSSFQSSDAGSRSSGFSGGSSGGGVSHSSGGHSRGRD